MKRFSIAREKFIRSRLGLAVISGHLGNEERKKRVGERRYGGMGWEGAYERGEESRGRHGDSRCLLDERG